MNSLFNIIPNFSIDFELLQKLIYMLLQIYQYSIMKQTVVSSTLLVPIFLTSFG